MIKPPIDVLCVDLRPVARAPFYYASVLSLGVMACSLPNTPPPDVSTIADAAVTDSGPPDTPAALRTLPVLGNGMHTVASVVVRVIGTQDDGLSTPRDLAFNPESPDQLWVVNGGNASVTIFQNTGTADQISSVATSPSSRHFLSRPAGLAFGAPGTFATAPEEDRVTQPSTPATFMGPTLWTSDLSIFEAGDASHLDMLHNSPNSVGIAWERDHTYWVVDGAHRSLTRYLILMPHALSGTDHSMATVARFVEGMVGYVPEVSSHAEYDHASERLYLADTGNNRIAALDPSTGTRGTTITPNYDGDVQYRMTGAQLTTFIDGAAVGLEVPSGLAIVDNIFYVTDNRTSRVYAFDRMGTTLDYLDLSDQVPTGGLMGITLDALGRVYLVDVANNRVLEISARM